MKLVVKNQQGENFDLNILPEDTFYDVQNRLVQDGKILLDMTKLAAPGRSFSMSSNVMEYFGLENCTGPVNETCDSKPPILKQENVKEDDDVLFGNVDDSKWDELQLKESADLVLNEANIKDQLAEGEEISRSYNINLRNVPFSAEMSEPMPLCRLCAQEICDEEPAYLNDVTTDDGTTLVDKINACLPINVSLKDKLPKQICSDCLVNVESSYIFSCCVTSAEERLNSLQFSSKPENMSCPLCCEGCMETAPASEFDVESHYSDESSQQINSNYEFIKAETATEYDPVQETNTAEEVQSSLPASHVLQGYQKKKRGRPKKYKAYTGLDEDDKDWCLEDEDEPLKKKSSFLQRGRPKGSKTKFLKPKNMGCFICHSKFKDFNEALTHTLSAHCDSVNETFPCPFCQSTLTSEQELSDHIDSHSDKRDVVIIHCSLCDQRFKQASEVHQHAIDKHLKREMHFVCPLCDSTTTESDQLAVHIVQDHVDKDMKTLYCPVCSIGFCFEKEVEEHLIEHHIEPEQLVGCSACDVNMSSEADCLNHIVQDHCTTTVAKVPFYYNCPICCNNFRSQYYMVKHTCNAIFDVLFCKECDKAFPTKARYVFHLQHHHSSFLNMRCDECLIVFTNEDTFYDHVRFQHEPDDQLQCVDCNKFFKNTLSLNMHMRRHLNTRDHKCNECGKRFQNAQTLREHRVSHMEVKPYQCHICGAYLSRLSRLRLHLRTHSVKSSKASMKAYKCSVCFQLFPNTTDAIKHSEGHTDVENINLEEIEVPLVYRCEYCDACFQKTVELNNHRKAKHTDPLAHNAYSCSICEAQFSTYARVTTHKLTHGINTETLIVPDEVNKGEDTFVIPQYFLCHECDKRCLHYTYLNLHRRFQHSSGKPIFTCTICSEKFATSWSLQFHKKKYHNVCEEKISGEGDELGVNTLYHCSICEKPYFNETSLEQHVKKCHQTGSEDPNSSFICEKCGKIFQFKTALDAHTDAHRGFKRFACKFCERRFTHRAGLIRHSKLHSEDDPFICEFCGKKFRDRTERENHRRAHTGERPFMCDICGRTFHTRAVWLDHSRIHQDIRPYQCDICSQSFRRSYGLKSHYLIHTGERPFSCEDCGKAFRLKQTLCAHRRKEHQNNEASNLIYDKVLLIEDSQFVDDDFDQDELPTLESSVNECVGLPPKTFLESGAGENSVHIEEVGVGTSAVWTSTSLIKQSDSWKTNSKSLLNKKTDRRTLLKERVEPQQGFSLLLKSGPINISGNLT